MGVNSDNVISINITPRDPSCIACSRSDREQRAAVKGRELNFVDIRLAHKDSFGITVALCEDCFRDLVTTGLAVLDTFESLDAIEEDG